MKFLFVINICTDISFTIQIIEKIPGNGNKNGSIDHKILEYHLQCEDYWMNILGFTYPFGLNEKPKFISKNVPVGKLFSPLPRYGERFLNAKTQSNIDKRILSSNISTSFN